MSEEITQTINGSQIREASISDRHIAGQLSESKLSINWESKDSFWNEVLKRKLIVFYRECEDNCKFKEGSNKAEFILRYPYESEDPDELKELPYVIKDMPFQIRNVSGELLLDEKGKYINIRVRQVIKIEEAKYLYDIELRDSQNQPYTPSKDIEIKIYIPLIDNLLNIQKDFPCTSYNYHDDIKYLLNLINKLAEGVYGYGYKEFLANPSNETLEEQFKDKFIGSNPLTRNIECPEIINEVFEARGNNNTLGERLSKSIDSTGHLIENRKIHYHVNLSLKMNKELSIMFKYLMTSKIKDTTVKADRDLIDIFVDGKLLSESQYELIEISGYIVGIKFNEESFKGDEKVDLKFTIYNLNK